MRFNLEKMFAFHQSESFCDLSCRTLRKKTHYLISHSFLALSYSLVSMNISVFYMLSSWIFLVYFKNCVLCQQNTMQIKRSKDLIENQNWSSWLNTICLGSNGARSVASNIWKEKCRLETRTAKNLINISFSISMRFDGMILCLGFKKRLNEISCENHKPAMLYIHASSIECRFKTKFRSWFIYMEKN